ncbi:MAG: TonB-dependent receptor [Chitinophagales bacterium]
MGNYKPLLLLKFVVLVTCLICFYSSSIYAQRTVTGQITGSDTNEPLPGVNVVIKGAAKGTVTDFDGNFTLSVNVGENILVFSFIGYKPQELDISGQSVINVQLAIDAEQLDEVVVVGYGTMRKSDLTGSVYSVKGEDLVKVPDANVIQGLQGKVPGVQVSSVSGNPGENPVIRIRGVSTFLAGASPVFVVDGVILNDIGFLNNNDIESIEVLKDASSTAIYGTRGANGVIIITTKKGAKGRPVINVGSTYSLEYVPNTIDLLDSRELAQIVNLIQPGRFNNIDILPNTDWQNLIFEDNAPIQKYDLSISGADDKFAYYLGGSYYDQQGILSKSDYQRLSLKLNSSFKASSFITLGTNLTFSKEDKTNPPGVVAAAYRAWPTSEPFDADGNFLEIDGAGNPLATIEYSNDSFDRYRAVGNLYADVNFLKDFTFRTSYQTDLLYFKQTIFSPVFFVSPTQQNEINDLTKTTKDESTWIWENTLRYDKTLENHRFDVLVGYTSQETSKDETRNTVEDLIREDPEFWYISAGDATTLDATTSLENYSYISYLFRLNYVLNDKYLFTGTFRRDGSSKFGPNNRYGNFPSLALGWRLSEEPFLAESGFSTLKLRGSWGINGNDRIPYQARFSRVNNNDLEAVFGFDEELFPGATLTDAGNPDLQWENTETFDVGLDFGLFDNKLTGEIEYYNKQTNKVLVPLLLPAHFGNGAFRRVNFNAADVNNSGLEFYINWKEKRGNFNYSLGFLGSTVKNEVTDVGAADEFIQDGNLNNGQLITRTEKGLAVGTFFGYKVAGVFQNEGELTSFPRLSGQDVGDFRYEDINNDGVINADDRTVIGSYIPDFMMGVNLQFGYKNFELLVDIQGQFGNEIYNGKRAVRPELYNYEASILDRWTGEGTSNTDPRLTTGGGNYTPSDWFIEDGSFVRLRSIALNYTLPASLSEKLHLQRGTLFVRGTNLYTMTDFTGYSPEIASQNVLSSGIDLGTYPVTAVYSAGINLTF